MERRQPGTPPREDVYEANMVGASAAEPGKGPGAGAVAWGCYCGGAAVDALIGYLNPVGLREGPLRRVRPLLHTCITDEIDKASRHVFYYAPDTTIGSRRESNRHPPEECQLARGCTANGLQLRYPLPA